MSIIDENGRLFGKINLLDFTIGSAMALAVLGILFVQSGWHVTSGKMIEGETDIEITVQIQDLHTLDTNLFVPGEKTSITIRNQPRGQVSIISATSIPEQITLITPSGKILSAPNHEEPNGYNFVIKLKDHAKITKEGYVTEGVKVKVGLPMELEGFKYRAYGRIIDVNPLSN